ncbi:MAG: outer membrane protein [Nitrospinaceae bacterium]
MSQRMRPKQGAILWMAILLGVTLSSPVKAETYIGGFVGASFGGDFTNIGAASLPGAPVSLGLTGSDLNTEESLAFGFRFGRYFSSIPWLGLEFQWYRRRPDADRQNLNFSGTLATPTGPFQIVGAQQTDVILDNLDTWGFMVNVRAPEKWTRLLGGKIEPYLGAGLGVNAIDIKNARTFNSAGVLLGQSPQDSDVDTGFLGQAGINYYVTPRLRAYVEYKYSGAHFTLERLAQGVRTQLDYTDHTIVLGMSFTLFK